MIAEEVVIECPSCRGQTITRRYKPNLPFADEDGWIELPCVVCYAADWSACKQLEDVLR